MQSTEKKDTMIVLTVGSSAQKHLCETLVSQLDLSDKKIEILCDDEFGSRIGSGGAILNALDKFYAIYQKLVIVNCGGLSKRTVNCAIKGKAFAQTLCSGRTVTLFEHILNNTLALSCSFDKGVLIACSDILIDSSAIKTDFCESIGFGIFCDIETGTQHGVMVTNQDDELICFLHKVDINTLKQYLKPNSERITVDSGMVFLNDTLVQQLLRIIETERVLDIIKNHAVELNFYSDIMPLLSKNLKQDIYFNNDTQNQIHLNLKKILYKHLQTEVLKVYTIDNQDFLHFGTNKQLLSHTLSISDKFETFLKINSFITSDVQIGSSTVLDNVFLQDGSCIGSNCLVTDISFNHRVNIDNNCAVCGFQLSDGNFVTVITDINENPKDFLDSSEIWNIPRFYKASSFDESLNKFFKNADEEKYSLKYCTENADFNYYILNKQYLAGLIRNRPNDQYLNMRKEIIESYLCKKDLFSGFVSNCDYIEVSMPVRVNLSGTWSDAMPYCIENGGEVINAAVTVDHTLPINVKLEKIDKKIIEFCSDEYKTVFSFDDANIDNDFSVFNLHKSVLKTVGINGINQLDCGLRLSTNVNIIDKGSGLGTSSILLAACFGAFSKMFSLNYSNEDIIEMVFVAEQIMKTGGGWQDQVGGLFSGIKVASSQPGIPQRVKVDTINLPEKFNEIFSKKAVLMPTGQRHFGRFIVNDVVNRYLSRTEEIDFAYSQMKDLNQSLLRSIEDGDADEFYDCINYHMQLLKLISPSITNKRIDRIIQVCMQVANAVSICGAGAGGYLLVFLKDEFSVDDFKLLVSEKFPEIQSEVLKIDIFYQGDKNER